MMRVLLLLATLLPAFVVHAEPITFGLFGDTPYTRWERQHLPELMVRRIAAMPPCATSSASSALRPIP
jgi:hypothetical protein